LICWDLSHLHEFVLAGGRRIGFVDPDPFEDDEVVEDHATVKVAGRGASRRGCVGLASAGEGVPTHPATSAAR
jgi:hypothetical protein